MANLFAKAKKVETAPKAAAKSKKAEHSLSGLKELAEVDAAIKSLTAVKKTLDQEVKASAFEIFCDEAKGKMPESFRGLDDNASASIECRKRGTNSPLSEAEVELLTSKGIEVKKQVTVAQLFGINPKYAADEAMLEKISAALEAAGVPDDVIVVQEEVSKFVVDEVAADKAFALGDRDAIEVVTTLAIKPKLESVDLPAILDNLKSVVVEYAPSDEKAA